MSKVIVISAHPDDEILGCGGTLLKHKANGDDIAWIITTGISESIGFSNERVTSRALEIEEIGTRIGASKIHQLDYPTMQLSDESLIKMVPQIAGIFSQFQPEVVYVVNRSDAHTDHHITFKSVWSCTKSFRHPYIKKVMMYECISETEFGIPTADDMFIPNYLVDVSDFMEDKLNAMNVYETELGNHPFPRSAANIKALALYRGAMAGVQYAEAFQLLKYIDK